MSRLPAEEAKDTKSILPPDFCLIHGLVLGLDGKLAPNRQVSLVGLSRGSMQENGDVASDWSFITDSHGRFSVKLGNFNTWETKENHPGWGTYALVVDPSAKDAGAVSKRFYHFPPSSNQARPDADEWGNVLTLPAEGFSITLQTKSGVTLEGTIWDYAKPGQPLPDITVATYNDLHGGSHTGHGGEILWQRVKTDAKGHFIVRHVYPMPFHVGLEEEETSWLKTRIDGQWADTVGDSMVPPQGAITCNLEIMATTAPVFKYFGKVVDGKGQPIEDATVLFGMSHHPTPQTWEDEHGCPSATTGSDGRYEILLNTPWVWNTYADASGYEGMGQWADDREASPFPPGEYNFTLRSK